MNASVLVDVFHALIIAHICVGSVGLLSFWVPIVAKKGGVDHIKWGRVFTWSMLITGSLAIAISSCTLFAPLETHPKIPDADLVRGIFGWMMQYLGILTINLAWYGWLCVLNRRDHARNREWRNMTLQAAVTFAAANTAWQGWLIGQPLMLGISIVGFATAGTNLRFLLKRDPGRNGWQYEHIKALVGAGISVYTAFFAFGAVRIMPELALNPAFWSIPLIVGLALILYHWRQIARRTAPRARTAIAT